ncbi:hypothetical protein [Brachybacterium muris]|uniref:hypothetical protein n=1 Tax=Brachybacterium muris TaxID=219301 RepID=UPI00223B0BE2|nr:hypothetical protein [Brachybacterium muris]MCT1654757.1 hypothetical protein [Brachybacterium muris]
MCLELACRLDERIGLGASMLGAELDPSRSFRSVLLFGPVAGGSGGDGGAGQVDPEPPRTVEELARDLAALDLTVLDAPSPGGHPGGDTAQLLHRALSSSVEAAMYWQEPDDQDALAARLEVREALQPLTESVAAWAPVLGWDRPCAPQQWILRWDRPGSADDSGIHRDVSR